MLMGMHAVCALVRRISACLVCGEAAHVCRARVRCARHIHVRGLDFGRVALPCLRHSRLFQPPLFFSPFLAVNRRGHVALVRIFSRSAFSLRDGAACTVLHMGRRTRTSPPQLTPRGDVEGSMNPEARRASKCTVSPPWCSCWHGIRRHTHSTWSGL